MNFKNAFSTAAERFMSYCRIDTQSDPFSSTFPSSDNQKDLSNALLEELIAADIQCELDEWGYVYASLPSNTTKEVPAICFCSHVDTAPDCSGKDVKPILHKNYSGQDIVLPDDPSIIISTSDFPILNTKLGEDIITASGLTLLGADDKAGVCAIMEAAIYLKQHPEILHGEISLLFTPDEEIGHGVDKVNLEKVSAKAAYTLDGGELGSLEDETFSADACTIHITGVSSHPGYAKGKMENAIKIASEIVAQLPKDRLSPESTSSYEGFVHPTKIEGNLESAKLEFIIRDFETAKLNQHVAELNSICSKVLTQYPNSKYELTQKEQYRNMKEILALRPEIADYAAQAIEEAGIPLLRGKIRGGTDGSRLSFMGLPCPNLFAGEHGIHSKKEWVSVQDMHKAAEVIVRLCTIWEQRS
ncbi:MAG: peptidase T [Saprospiraceae bacterium]|nr:peptidase T [Candidatus Defluviibacterium haderslevense]